MSGRRAHFDSPPGGSRSSSRYTSDSGVGSLSDQASHGRPDRDYEVTEDQWNDLHCLQEAYNDLKQSRQKWKATALLKNDELTAKNKEHHQVTAQWRGTLDENGSLKDSNALLTRENRRASEEITRLKKENDLLSARNDWLEKRLQALLDQQNAEKAPKKPSPTPAEPRVYRSTSIKEKEKESEREKKRLSKRFDRTEGDNNSEGTNSSASRPPITRASRRTSYVEPWGPGGSSASLPTVIIPNPSSSSQRYSTYGSSAQRPAPVYVETQDTTYASIPRTAGVPTYPVFVDQPFMGEPVEDGNYHPHPLPREKVTREKATRERR